LKSLKIITYQSFKQGQISILSHKISLVTRVRWITWSFRFNFLLLSWYKKNCNYESFT